MKRIVLFVVVMFVAAGCAALKTPASVANRVRIGMHVNEFKQLAGSSLQIDGMTEEHTVYRIDNHNIGTPDYVVSATLFHFDSDKRLVRVETRDFAPPAIPPPDL